MPPVHSEPALRERRRVRAEALFFLRRLEWLGLVATVGSVPEPLDTGWQVVQVLLIIFGVGTLFYGLVTTTEFFVAGHLSGLLQERRMQRRVDRLSDHYIIRGFGRVGRQVARDLTVSGARS